MAVNGSDIPEGSHLHTRRLENLKSHIVQEIASFI
jgi:hypothetical protein